MRLLNDMLNMHDGFDDAAWLKACKKLMVETFPREDPFTILAPAGFDIDKVNHSFCIILNFCNFDPIDAQIFNCILLFHGSS